MEWDFMANIAVDDIEKVPEGYRSAYAEDKKEGKFMLKDDFRPLAEAYTSVHKKLLSTSKSRQEDNKKDQTRRQTLDALSTTLTEAGWELGDDPTKLPEIVKAKLTEIMDAVKSGKDVKVNLEAIKQTFGKQVAEVTAKKDGEIAQMRTSLESHMIDSAAAQALAELGTVEKGADLIMPLVRKFSKVVKGDDGTYAVRIVDSANDVRVNGKGDVMSVKDLVAEMKTAYPMAFRSETKPGSGKTPGTGKVTAATKPAIGKEDSRSPTEKIAAGLAARAK